MMTCVCSFEHDSFAWRERAECVRVLVEIRSLEFPGLFPHFSGECLWLDMFVRWWRLFLLVFFGRRQMTGELMYHCGHIIWCGLYTLGEGYCCWWWWIIRTSLLAA